LADELGRVRANAVAADGLEQAEELLAQARELRRLLATADSSSPPEESQ
jgi:hypothetical protein